MRWVKDTLPPRLRRRKSLITIRLSAISFAGTARTDVAVGTSRDAVMFRATAALAPRSGVLFISLEAVAEAADVGAVVFGVSVTEAAESGGVVAVPGRSGAGG